MVSRSLMALNYRRHSRQRLILEPKSIGADMRLYSAICSVIEAWAEHLRTDTLENEFANADWALMGSDEDDD